MTQRARGYLSRIAQPVRAGESVLKPHPAPQDGHESANRLVPVIEDRVTQGEAQGLPNLSASPVPPATRRMRNAAARASDVLAETQTETRRQAATQDVAMDHGRAEPAVVPDAPLSTKGPVKARPHAQLKPLAEVRSAAPARAAEAAQPMAVSAGATSVPSARELETAAQRPRLSPQEKVRTASGGQAAPTTVAEDGLELMPVRRAEGETPRAANPVRTREADPILKSNAAANTETRVAEPARKAPTREPGTPEAAQAEKTAEGAGPRVSIGTLEIRAVMAQKPAPQQMPVMPPAPPVSQRAPGRAAEATPLARGLGWSYGLVQE